MPNVIKKTSANVMKKVSELKAEAQFQKRLNVAYSLLTRKVTPTINKISAQWREEGYPTRSVWNKMTYYLQETILEIGNAIHKAKSSHEAGTIKSKALLKKSIQLIRGAELSGSDTSYINAILSDLIERVEQAVEIWKYSTKEISKKYSDWTY